MHHSFRADPPGAGRLPGHENAVCHRQIRRGVTVENELAAHDRHAHPRGPRLPSGARYSVSACATTAEIGTPERPARLRSRLTSAGGSCTVTTTVACGTTSGPVAAAWST